MRSTLSVFTTGLFALLCAAALTGCGLGTSFPDTQVPIEASETPLGTVAGSDFGGHSPIAGAHVFVLEITPTGYGGKVTSLLSSTSANSGFPTQLDNSSAPTNGMYYVTTSTAGQLALSGDYTCTAGDPVYLYAAGGNPNPSLTVVNITGASAAPDSNGNLLVTFNNSGNNNLTAGEVLTFGTVTNGTFGGFSNTTQVVSSMGLSATTFSVELGPSSSTVAQTSFNATAQQFGNPAIANMALLGICPGLVAFSGIPSGSGTSTMTGVSAATIARLAVGDVVTGPGVPSLTITALNAATGTITFSSSLTGGNTAGPYYSYQATYSATENFSSLNFVFMNEVSTIAAAYALAPFASTASNDALHIGTSSTNLQGLQNAVLNAANLYDIQGSNVGTGGYLDAHIARMVTPNNAGGTVPQATLDTLGNILAACVDSANLYGSIETTTSSTESGQCSALFSAATSTGGSGGTKPYDTATAALNIAKHPAGSGTTTFASSLFNIPTGNQPFLPALGSAPNDFSIGISYTNVTPSTALSGPNGIAIDANGDAWVPTTGGVINEIGPTGSLLSGSSGYSSGTSNALKQPAIDGAGNLWAINNNATLLKMTNAGTLVSATYSTGAEGTGCLNAPTPQGFAIDGSNNVWVANYYGDNQANGIEEVTNAGTPYQGFNTNNNTCSQTPSTGTTVVRNLWGMALDGQGVVYGTGYSTENIAAVNTSTVNGSYTAFYNSNSTANLPDGPAYPAVDQNGKVWIPNYYAFVSSVNTAGAGTSVSVFTPPSKASATATTSTAVTFNTYSGGGINAPRSIAVDGANNIWVVSDANPYVSELSNSGTALTPSTGYSGGITANVGRDIAIDGSGNVWTYSAGNNAVIQMIGVATPVITPLATAAKAGTPAGEP